MHYKERERGSEWYIKLCLFLYKTKRFQNVWFYLQIQRNKGQMTTEVLGRRTEWNKLQLISGFKSICKIAFFWRKTSTANTEWRAFRVSFIQHLLLMQCSRFEVWTNFLLSFSLAVSHNNTVKLLFFSKLMWLNLQEVSLFFLYISLEITNQWGVIPTHFKQKMRMARGRGQLAFLCRSTQKC